MGKSIHLVPFFMSVLWTFSFLFLFPWNMESGIIPNWKQRELTEHSFKQATSEFHPMVHDFILFILNKETYQVRWIIVIESEVILLSSIHP